MVAQHREPEDFLIQVFFLNSQELNLSTLSSTKWHPNKATVSQSYIYLDEHEIFTAIFCHASGLLLWIFRFIFLDSFKYWPSNTQQATRESLQ